MGKATYNLQKVVRVDQSPLNPTRWCLTLDCGCERWVTAKRKSRATAFRCIKHNTLAVNQGADHGR